MKSITVYHYSSVKFEQFDLSKCDGFWFTNIEPSNAEMLNEIGAAGSKFCAKCIIQFENELNNGNNYDVEDQLSKSGCDAIVNSYDGFTDYALINNAKIKIVEWIDL